MTTGTTLLAITWSITLISLLLLFDVVQLPLDGVASYYSLAMLLVPVMMWLWCVVSWVGLKLFKHAKGGNAV